MLAAEDILLYEEKRTSDIDLSSTKLLKELKKFLNGDTQWLLVTYDGPKDIVVHSSGTIIDDMKKNLSPDDVYYGVFSIYYHNIRRHSFFSFIGEKVSGMKRAKVSMHRNAVGNYFEGSICHFAWESIDEITLAEILLISQSVGLDPAFIAVDFSEMHASGEDIAVAVERERMSEFRELTWFEGALKLIAEAELVEHQKSPSKDVIARLQNKYSSCHIEEIDIWLSVAALIFNDPRAHRNPGETIVFSFHWFYSDDIVADDHIMSLESSHEFRKLNQAHYLIHLLGLRLFLGIPAHVPKFLNSGGLAYLMSLWNDTRLHALCHNGAKTLSKILLNECIFILISYYLLADKAKSTLPTLEKETTSSATKKDMNPNERLIIDPDVGFLKSGVIHLPSAAKRSEVNPVTGLLQARLQKEQQQQSEESKSADVREFVVSDKKPAVNPVAGLLQARLQKEQQQQSEESKDCSSEKFVESIAAQSPELSVVGGSKAEINVSYLLQARLKNRGKNGIDKIGEVFHEEGKEQSCQRTGGPSQSEFSAPDTDSKAKPVVKNIYETRRCYWEPIDDCTGTVFDISLHPRFNGHCDHHTRGSFEALRYPSNDVSVKLPSDFFSQLKAVFTKEVIIRELTEAERIGQAVGAIGGKLGKGTLTFLDRKRFNNIAIKLRQMNKTNQFIRNAVLTLDENFFSLDRVRALLACAPTGDDMESIAPYDGDPDLLALCERFFYDIQDVPLFTNRVQAIMEKFEFEEEIELLLCDIGIFSMAILSVAQSKALVMFTNLVLQIGNYLNESAARKSVTGFDVSFLPKLSYIKSGDLKTNMMRFIVDYFDQSPSHSTLIDDLIRDLRPSILASRISILRLDASLSNLNKRLNKIKIVRMSVANKNKRGKVEGDLFEEKMGAFLDTANSLLTKFVTPQIKHIHSVSSMILRFYGVVAASETNDAKGETFFQILMELIANIGIARKTNVIETEKKHIKQLKIEAFRNVASAKAASKERLLARTVASETEPSDNGRNIHKSVRKRRSQFTATGPIIHENSFADQVTDIREKMRNRGSAQDRAHDPTFVARETSSSLLGGFQSSTERDANKSCPSNQAPDTFFNEESSFGDMIVSAQCLKKWHEMHAGGPTSWLAMALDNISSRLEYLGSGDGGMHEMISEENVITTGVADVPWIHDYGHRESLSATKPFVACFRVVGIDGSSRRFKFVAIYFNHSDVPLRVRSQLAQLKRHVQEFLTGVHVEFSVDSSLLEITEAVVCRKILAAAGAHAPKRFEF